MGDIRVDNQLIGSLAETYYKEHSDQNGWAYTSLENISRSNFENNELDFKLGFDRFKIKIPDSIVSEIKSISQPEYSDSRTNPSYVFDFLSCPIHSKDEIRPIIDSKKASEFRWVEVKSSGGRISNNQYEKISKVKMSFVLCVVNNVRETPYDVSLEFYYDEIPRSMLD